MPRELANNTIRRIIVVGIVRNDQGEYLICKMPPNRGVFPGQWGLPGGGVEDGETIDAALRREMKEELGIGIKDIKPLLFKDAVREKTYPDGSNRMVYMVFLIYECRSDGNAIALNDEFCEYAWVRWSLLPEYALNEETRDTFRLLSPVLADNYDD